MCSGGHGRGDYGKVNATCIKVTTKIPTRLITITIIQIYFLQGKLGMMIYNDPETINYANNRAYLIDIHINVVTTPAQ